MLLSRSAVIAIFFGVLVLAAPVAAQTFDHLACAPLVAAGDDEHDDSATGLPAYADAGRVRIDALQERFDARGCKVRRARLQCGSRARVSLDPAQPLAFVEGDEPADDMICYRVRCRRAGQAELASDAFGTRPIGRLRSQLLCVPVA